MLNYVRNLGYNLFPPSLPHHPYRSVSADPSQPDQYQMGGPFGPDYELFAGKPHEHLVYLFVSQIAEEAYPSLTICRLCKHIRSECHLLWMMTGYVVVQ